MAYGKPSVNRILESSIDDGVINFGSLDNYMYLEPVTDLSDAAWWSKRLKSQNEPHMLVELSQINRSPPNDTLLTYTILKNLEGHVTRQAVVKERVFYRKYLPKDIIDLSTVRDGKPFKRHGGGVPPKAVTLSDGKLIKSYDSIVEASRCLGIADRTVAAALRTGKPLFGLIVRYK